MHGIRHAANEAGTHGLSKLRYPGPPASWPSPPPPFFCHPPLQRQPRQQTNIDARNIDAPRPIPQHHCARRQRLNTGSSSSTHTRT
eukprot:2241035-Rhodomonas_salina.2